jgi:AcrR family transcriptional regulator
MVLARLQERKSMGRKTIRNVDEKIMVEVIRETHKYGIAKISTKDLARRVHVSESMLFAHFETKQNLLDKTFCYAISRMPKRPIFPDPDIDVRNPEVYEAYLSCFREILKCPDEVVFEDAYCHSSYFYQDFVNKVNASLVNQLISTFEKYETMRSPDQRWFMVIRYLENVTSELAQIARGVVPNTEENLRIAIGTTLFGIRGLLTDYKTLK